MKQNYNLDNNRYTLDKELLIISEMVENGSKVLDIGCGEGNLLAYLKDHKQVIGRGIELDGRKAAKAVSHGLSVIQGDADTDLFDYPNDILDYAILSKTLQATKNPKQVLEEMLRIAKYAIVSVPNFGHLKNRLHLLFRGRMPVTKTLSYQWYETPNIHFCTIKDFVILCNEMDIKIERKLYLTNSGTLSNIRGHGGLANLFGETAIFLLTKRITVNSGINFPSKLSELKKNGLIGVTPVVSNPKFRIY